MAARTFHPASSAKRGLWCCRKTDPPTSPEETPKNEKAHVNRAKFSTTDGHRAFLERPYSGDKSVDKIGPNLVGPKQKIREMGLYRDPGEKIPDV